MPLDITPYLHHLDGYDLTEEQKAEVIRSIHHMMEGFVDIAFGVDATQLSLRARRINRDGEAPDQVDCYDTIISTFNDAAHKGAAGTSAP